MKKLTLLLSAMLLACATNLWAETATYQHVFNAKPSTGNNITLSGVSWNITATALNNYNNQNYAGVQFGSKSGNGEITLTSSSDWNFNGNTKITEVRLWLNLGGTSVTPSVTIGGKPATSDGTTVIKNSSAGSDWTKATKVTFTPAADGNTGVVVINVTSVKAGYICAMEIDSESDNTPAATLSTIALSGTPTKKTYMAGESLNTDGLVVTGTYSDGSTQAITEGITWEIDPDPLTAGTTEVYVIAGVKNAAGTEITADITVTGLTVTAPKTLTSIAVSGTPAEFWKGDTFNHEGITVTATWDDASTTDVTAEATFSTPDMATAGVKTITVTYKDKTATYDITVKTIANTQETAYTTTQAIALIDAGKDLTSNVYVKGTISQIDVYSSGTITYWLDQNTFEVYKGKNLNNTNFTAEDDVVKGAEVIVYGQITKFGSTYEFNTDNYLASYKAPDVVKQDPTLTLGTYKTSMDANEANDEYSVTYDGDGTLSVTSSNEEVATVTIDGTNIVVDALTEGTTTITISATETDTYYFVEKKYTLTVYPAWVATSLPFEFDGGKNDINQGNGMKQNGIENKDYSSSPKLKFGETGASLIIWFNETAASVSYAIKGYPSEGTVTSGTFEVFESEDNQNYTALATYVNLTTTKLTETKTLSSSTRYIKFVYSNKVLGNVALGAIKIAKPSTPSAIDNAAVETPAIKTIENGQIIILRDGKKYNAMGVRLQ